MSSRNDKREKETLHIKQELVPGWNERQQDIETNAERIAWNEEKNGPSFDANSMTDEDFDNMVDVPVYDQYERIIGYKSVIKKKRRQQL